MRSATPVLPHDRRLDRALALLEARFGVAVARRLRDAIPRQPEERSLPSGSLALDRATGLGGFPRGHVTELIGAASSGKTALLYAALAAAQRAGGLAALVDAEGTADPDVLLACGIELDTLVLARPVSATDALLLLAILARCGALDLLALSSVPALRDLPAGRMRPSLDDHSLAAPDLGRLLARGLRVLTAALADTPTVVLATNEPLRPREGRDATAALRSTGGLALAHFAALRVTVEPLAQLPDPAGGPPGLRVALTVVKHKLGTPGGRAVADLHPGRGLDPAAELLALGLACGIIARDWRGHSIGGIALGHRPADAAAALLADPALAARVRAAILAGDDHRNTRLGGYPAA
jgi:recombination protein RecA